MNPPVVVIGCHRAGTSLMTEILGRFGIFMGYKVSGHNEALFFLRANQYLMNLGHARWDNPTPVNNLVRVLDQNQNLCDEFLTFFREKLLSQIYGEYWGSPNERPEWGWKDPRNSFTLPIWRHVYPEMKVIHIYRNGVDVAASLQLREQSRGNKFSNHTFSCRCMNLDSSFSLWSEYTSQCRQVMKTVPAESGLTIQYENLLQNPAEEFLRLESFLKIPTDKIKEIIEALAKTVNTDNAFKFVKSDRLLDFYHSVQTHPLMDILGYGTI
jgi:hypothetical protein